MTQNELTLVLGGTGKTGRRIAERLHSQNVPTRIAARSTSPAFDWNDPAGWDAVLDGVTAMYICYTPDLAVPGAAEAIQTLVNKATEHHVQRLVLLSGRGEEVAQRCEQIVQSSGIAATVLRASWFNQNFSEGEFAAMVQAGELTLPIVAAREPFIDVDDIADVAVAALTDARHAGKLYELTGPRLMSFADVAKEIAAASGRNIRFNSISLPQFTRALARDGMPDDAIWLLEYLFGTVLDGRSESVQDGVQQALGRLPRDFHDYALDTAASGAWDEVAPLQQVAH